MYNSSSSCKNISISNSYLSLYEVSEQSKISHGYYVNMFLIQFSMYHILILNPILYGISASDYKHKIPSRIILYFKWLWRIWTKVDLIVVYHFAWWDYKEIYFCYLIWAEWTIHVFCVFSFVLMSSFFFLLVLMQFFLYIKRIFFPMANIILEKH